MKKGVLRFLSIVLLASFAAFPACVVDEPVPGETKKEAVQKPKTTPSTEDAKSENTKGEDADTDLPGPGDPCKDKKCGSNASCVNGNCECNNGYSTYEDGDECLNAIKVPCKVPYGYLVPNGRYNEGFEVTITFVGGSWGIPNECPVICNDGFTDDINENCVRVGGGAEKLPCLSENMPQYAIAIQENKPTIWDGTAWVADVCSFKCDDEHIMNEEGTGCRELSGDECGKRDVFISEVFEGCAVNESGTRYIELYNSCAFAVDLSDYLLRIQTNSNSGSTSWENVVKAQKMKNLKIGGGKTLLFGGGSNASGLNSLGIMADMPAQISIDGDDRVALYNNKEKEIIDIYGEENVSGSNKYWNYKDKKAIRKPGKKAEATFVNGDAFSDTWELVPITACSTAADVDSLGHHDFALSD